jgi:hypothetical protein
MYPYPRQNNTFTGLFGGFEALFTAFDRFSYNGKKKQMK